MIKTKNKYFILNICYLRLIIILLFTVFSSQFSVSSYSQSPWIVPADKKVAVAPFKFDKVTVKKGEELFIKNCKACHGIPGTGTNVKMTPQPVDPISKQYQSNTDGEIFYKMTEGRGPMPSFKSIIPAYDRWLIISYVRSFNKEYKQPEPLVTQASKISRMMKINISWNRKAKAIDVNIAQLSTDIKQKLPAALSGYNINLFAKRYFGTLKLTDSKVTDINGNVSFQYPDDLPGDRDGNINIKVVAENEAAGFSVSRDTVFKIGTPANQSKLLDRRAWWNVRSKAPVWLILSYSLSVLTVLSLIIYIIYLLYKVWKSGKSVNV